MTELLAPNGKPSNLTAEQYKLVRLPEFKAWFGDWENLILTKLNDSGIDEVSLKRLEDRVSKVVDENGEPLLVFHGTNEDFNIFKSKKNFFTPSKKSALWFVKVHRTSDGEPKVYEVFLNSKKLFNPFNLKENEKKSIIILVENHDNKDDFYEDFDFFKNDWDMNHLSDSEFILKVIQDNSDTSYTIIESSIFQDWLIQNKYDGFMVGEYDFETPNYAVYNSNQIKLADGTNTTFDGNNPDIRYNDGGSIPKELYHYTSETNFDRIFDSNILNPSQKYGNRLSFTSDSEYHKKEHGLDYGNINVRITFDNEKLISDGYSFSPFDHSSKQNKIGKEFEYIISTPIKNIKNYIKNITIFKGNAIVGEIDITNTDYANKYYLKSDVKYKQGGLLAPNGKPSNLTPEQYKLVRTKAFISWFGDWQNDPTNASKVVDDETKEPLVVYHGYLVGGGAGRKFYEFKNLPAFFSKTKQFAYDYASTKSMDAGIDADIDTYACFLNIRKLFDSKNKENIKLAEEQLPEKIRVSHGTAWFLSADIPKEEVIEQMMGIITIQTDDLLVKDILSSNVGDIIAEKVSASQYENKTLLYKDEDWGYITDAINFNEVVEKEVAEFIYKENTKPFETGITYRGKNLKKFTFNEETYSYELNKDPLFLEYINEVEKRKKYYIDNILNLLKNNIDFTIVAENGKIGRGDYFYVRKINLKTYKTTTKNNWTMFENETLQKFLIDNNFGGWCALERGDKTYGVYNNKNIKLADGTNSKFDGNNPDIRFDNGGSVVINPTEIECHKCNWKWEVKDGGDDLFICHKCNYDNSKFYKFEGLEGEKILDTITYAKGGQLLNLNQIRKGQYEAKSDEIEIYLTNPKILNGIGTNKWQLIVMYRNDDVINEWFETKNEALKTGVYLLNDFFNNNFKKGGRTIAQTPAPKKDQIKGSDKNKEGSAKDISSAKKIKFSDDVLEKIQNSVDKHNEKHPNKKITIDSAKAVVRRGMGAYSSTHRPTISGGNENSRVAWGLARLNAFLYKIVNGKSKSGKYSQDNDLIEELGYKVQKYEIGGIFQGTPYDFNVYSTEYIGTGEGNQVFGWGLYFTDNKDVARYYMSAGLYDDEQKIKLDNKSLSEYNIEQDVKDQLVGIVDTIFSEDKMIPTINSIKDYLFLEYDEENYPELKEIVELSNKTYNFIKDKKLSFIGNIYSLTLFKGKNPNEYDLLDWEQKPTESQILKIKNQAKKEGVDLLKLPFDLERYRDSNAIYTDLSQIISGVSHLKNRDSGKMCSEFLLRAGIDGIRYKAGTLSGFEDEEGYNYVIFDANDITIEGKEKYDEILAGNEKYADGGDIQAYEDAMGISYAEGGETKPKKIYVSIPLKSKYENILNEKGLRDGSTFRNYQEKTFEDLQIGKLVGVIGVSSSPHNVGEWFYQSDCLIVMKYDEFVKLNDFTIIDYDNPEQLMADDMKLLNRLYQNKRDENTDEETLKGQRRNILQNVLGKFKQPFDIAIKKEPNLSTKQGLYRIEHFIEESYKFINWIVNNNNILNSSDNLAEKIIEYHYSDDSNYISTFYGNTEDKNIDKKYILPFVIEMIKSAGNVFKSEQEIYLNNKILNIPTDSQLFFKNEKERKSNLLELIDKYKLREKYSVYFVKHQDIEKYSSLASQKRYNIAQEKFNSDRKELEIKKDAVVHELLYFFLGQSLKSFKEIIEKEIAEYSDSTLFYYDYDEERKEIDWYGIILVQAIINKYIEIIQNNWKQFISTKDVKDITIHSFYDFQNNSYRELKKYFEDNKLELEKINDYHNINGNWLNKYRIEYWLGKSVYDYQDMPEWIDHKELAKMYLEKMDAQMYRYYSEQEIPLFSKYNEGGSVVEEIYYIPTDKSKEIIEKFTHYKSGENYYPKTLWAGWFLSANRKHKEFIAEEINSNIFLKNALISNWYDDYVKSDNITFEDFLNKDIEVYRGQTSRDLKYGEAYGFDSYTTDKSLAEKFAKDGNGLVIKKNIKPKQTYGLIQSVGNEKEIIIPTKFSNEFLEKKWYELSNENMKVFDNLSDKDYNQFNELQKSKNYQGLIDKLNDILKNKSDIVFENGGSILLAPNGKPSNLTPEQYKLVRTPEFKAWFGDWENSPETASKIVDDNGEPLPVFHGSRQVDEKTKFNSFNIGNGYYGKGIYFTSNKKEAFGWALGNYVYEVFLDVKNPFRETNYRKWNEYVTKDNDYSGIIIMDFQDISTIIVFNPEQIKLADGSNSKFDGNNPDIRFDNGGEADEPTNFWGTEAGGVLVYCSTTERYLILLRSEWVLEPNTWGIISGKLDDDETNIEDAVLRESEEETGHKLGDLIPSFIFEKPNFKFHNFVSIVDEEFVPELNWENTDYKWVKLNEMPDNLHFGLKLLLQKEDLPKLVKKNKMENEILIVEMNMYFNDTSVNFKNKEIPLKLNPPKNQNDFIDWSEENNIEFEQWGDFWNWESEVIDTSYGYTFEIPLFKYIEYMKTEKFYTGGELKKGIKTEMEHKDTLSKIKTGKFSVRQGAEMIAKDHLKENDKYYTHLSKMESEFKEGGKVKSIHSQKGDIMVSLDDDWYSDDSSVELVPVSELIKFREFDRKVSPKYNKENSVDNINHLKYMFKKEGVKSPLIIEYSADDNAVLIIEGNHRLNSAIDLGMEYLPARVVLKKYGKYSPAKIKNAMKVDGIKANSSNYIPSDLKPSYIGIAGVKPIAYAEGGIIEGRLHSECGDDGCGRKFQVGENGHIIEAERDEAVIVAGAFNDNKEMTIEGTPSEIASALNVVGGGKNFNDGAKIVEDGTQKEVSEIETQATDTDVDDVIDTGSIIINRRSMADEKSYKVTGSAKQIASAINSINGNGVVIEKGAKIE